MMTDYGDIQNMEQAKDLGILYYINKPFDVFELRKRVKKILSSSWLLGSYKYYYVKLDSDSWSRYK